MYKFVVRYNCVFPYIIANYIHWNVGHLLSYRSKLKYVLTFFIFNSNYKWMSMIMEALNVTHMDMV